LEGNRIGESGKPVDRRDIFIKVGCQLPEEESPGSLADPMTNVLLGSGEDHSDFLEIHGPTKVVAALAAQGLKITTPIDLSQGFDNTTQNGQEAAWKIVTEKQPVVVYLSPFHVPWDDMQEGTSHRAKTRKLRQLYRPQLQFCAQVMKYHMKNGRYFILDGPEHSSLQYQKEIQHLVPQAHGTSCSFHSARKGHLGLRIFYTTFHNSASRHS